MAFKIVRNDITKMNIEAIVNTANEQVKVGSGCDIAVYKAAGYDQLLDYRKKYIGVVSEGKAFITPGFGLNAKFIIHTVSPLYIDGKSGEEEKLRDCYKNSLKIAKENGIKEIAFPLISTGSFKYPKEEGMRIAIDEINRFLLTNEMDITLVVFDSKANRLGKNLFKNLDSYINESYVRDIIEENYFFCRKASNNICFNKNNVQDDIDSKLEDRIKHLSDTFSEYLLFLIKSKGMKNSDVYKRAIVDKKVFSKIKNNPDYHPQKTTVLQLCIGAMLNLDEAVDLLSRAGYALSPCNKTDIIFSYFIENEIYDMIDIDIKLEEYGLPYIIQ